MIPLLINIPKQIETDRLMLKVPELDDSVQLHEAIMDEDVLVELAFYTYYPAVC